MAKSYIDIQNSVKAGNIMDWTNALNRLSGVPVDITSTQESYEAAVKYAAENPVAYEGQVISVPKDGDIFIYAITPQSQGTLKIEDVDYEVYIKEVGSVPEVDGATIIINAEGKLEAVQLQGDSKSISITDGKISLLGVNDAGALTLPRMKADKSGIEWVAVSEVVQGDGNTITSGDGKSIVTSGDEDTLTAKLVGFDDATSGQIAVKNEDGTLSWKDEYSYDDTPLLNAIEALEGTVGKAAEGETSATGLVKDVADIKDEIGTKATETESATGIYKVIEDAASKAVTDASYDDTKVKQDIQTNADAIKELQQEVDNIVIPEVPVTNVSGDGKVISVTDTEGDFQVAATLSLNYDATNTKLQLLGIGGTVLHEIDAKAFIKDGMLDSVELDTQTEEGKAYLVLTWNTDADKTVTRLDVTELIDVYTSGNGVNIEASKISLKLGTGTETVKYLTVSEDGLNLSGVDKAIEDAVAAHNTAKSHLTQDDVDSRIETKLTEADYDKKIADAKQEAIDAATQADFITSVNEDDKLKVTEGKLEFVDGYQALSDADKAKLDKLTLTGDDLTISGSVEAGSVNNLDVWISENRETVDGLMSATQETKLTNIEEGAQVNAIEEIQVNGVKVDPVEKVVNIQVPDAVVTSDEQNKVTIEEDKTMTVNSITTDKLVNSADENNKVIPLVLYGGSASDLI